MEKITVLLADDHVLVREGTCKLLEREEDLRVVSEPPEERGLEQLTERELKVLQLAARGMSNKDIAHHLSLSVRTVQAHLSTVFSKMRVGSRTEAVVQALQKGWLVLEMRFSSQQMTNDQIMVWALREMIWFQQLCHRRTV